MDSSISFRVSGLREKGTGCEGNEHSVWLGALGSRKPEFES